MKIKTHNNSDTAGVLAPPPLIFFAPLFVGVALGLKP